MSCSPTCVAREMAELLQLSNLRHGDRVVPDHSRRNGRFENRESWFAWFTFLRVTSGRSAAWSWSNFGPLPVERSHLLQSDVHIYALLTNP